MRYLLISLIVLASASPELMNKLGLGKSCTTNKSFVTTDFTVTPYPPQAGKPFQVSMSGTFSNAQYVADLNAKVDFNNGKYSNNYFDINKNYNVGQVYTFNYTLTAGSASGIYDVQTLLEKAQGSSFSCWDFSYHI